MTTAPVYPRHEQPDLNPWFVRLPLLLMLWAMLFIITLLVLVMAYQNHYTDRVLPGVSAYSINLSGMTSDEAAQVLASQFTFDETAIFTFRDGERTWQLSAGELGVRLDLDATLDAVMSTGRTSFVTQALTWLNGDSIAPIIVYDQNVAVAKLNEIAAEIYRPVVDGALQVEGTQMNSVTAQNGRALDVKATLATLSSTISNLTTGTEVPLVILETLPTVFDTDLVASRAQAAISAPLTLVTEDEDGNPLGPWTISTEQIAALLNIREIINEDGTRRYEVDADLSAFRPYLETLAPSLITPAQDARFHFNPVTRQLEVIHAAKHGREMNVDQTLKNLEQKLFSVTDRTAVIAYNSVLPRYHNSVNAADLGITELVVEATTYYTGSPTNRRQNIAVGAALYDGIIVGPGEEFSFNYWLGDLSEEAGFTEGNVIFGGRTIQGIGGGICQVSTTIFRAAFKGGYTMIERNPHGYRVGYYEQNSPPGMDAAIWTPDRDFRFQNDTPHHLLIETEVFPATNTLQFRFYSTSVGRQVEIQEAIVKNVLPPKPTLYEVNSDLRPGEILQVDYAAEGADVTVYRIIRDQAGNVTKEDSIYTHYLPWAAIYQVAPGDSRLN